MGAGSGKQFPEGVPENPLEWNKKHMKAAALFYFDLYDQDDSDSVDVTELDALLKGLWDDVKFALANIGCPLPKGSEAPSAEDFLEENDADENDTLSSEELCPPLEAMFGKLKAMAIMRTEWEAQCEKVFKENDKDKNGKLSVEEFKESQLSAEEALGEKVDEEYAAWFDECAELINDAFDEAADEDGELTLAQFKDFNAEILPTLEFPEPPSAPAQLSPGAKSVQASGAKAAKKTPPKKSTKRPPPKKKGAKGTGPKGGKKAAAKPAKDEAEDEDEEEEEEEE